MFDVQEIKNKDLLAYVQADLGMNGKKRGKGRTFPCPFHGDSAKDGGSLYVTSDPHLWKCFGACNDSGDVISYVMRRDGATFREACERLGAKESDAAASSPARPIRATVIEPVYPPSPEWQAAAAECCERARVILWSDRGARAREYLNRRGLTDATLKAWGLGYNPDWYDTPIMRPPENPDHPEPYPAKMPAGIVIPCHMGRDLWMVKVRQTGQNPIPKYLNLWGGDACLFGAHTLKGHRAAVLTEGEFDAMLLHQEGGDLVGVATTTAGAGTWKPQWNAYLVGARRIFTAYDPDAAGKKGADALAALSKRVRTLQLPEGQDVTDFHQAGGDLRAWLNEGIAAEPVAPVRSDGVTPKNAREVTPFVPVDVADVAPDTDATAPPAASEPTTMPRPFYRVRSHLLGGEIILAVEDDYAGPLPSGPIAYTRSEMEAMRALTPDEIRAIHEAKALGEGGRYVGPTPSPNATARFYPPPADRPEPSAISLEIFTAPTGADGVTNR